MNDNLTKVYVFNEDTPNALRNEINKFISIQPTSFQLIDIKYSTTTINEYDVIYSALMIYKVK